MGDQVRDALLQAGINLADMNKPKVYLDFNRPSLEFEMDVIRFILIPINKPMKIFLQARDAKVEDYRALFRSTKIELTFLDESISINPQSIDVLVALGMDSEEIIIEKLPHICNLLKPDGFLITFLRSVSQDEHNRTRGPPVNTGKFFQDLMANFPEEYRAKLTKDLPAVFFMNNQHNQIQVDQMNKQLNLYFEKIIPIAINPFINVVCARVRNMDDIYQDSSRSVSRKSKYNCMGNL